MARVTENWFYENKDIHHSELANFLDDVIIAEFNCDVQVIIPFPVSIILYPAPTVTCRTGRNRNARRNWNSLINIHDGKHYF